MIPVVKNSKYILDIIDITGSGEGIGKIDGFTVFVEGAIPEDKVEVKVKVVKKNYATGYIIKLLKSSPYRVAPKCKYFKWCGGCQTQDIDYNYQLEIKQKLITDNLTRIGKLDLKDIEIKQIIGMTDPYNYRNKAQYKIDQEGLGFYQKKSHDIVNVKSCSIQSSLSDKTIKVLNEFIKNNHISIYNEETGKGILRGIVERVSYYNNEIMLIFVINGNDFKYKDELISYIKENLNNVVSIYFNINMNKTNVVLSANNKLAYGKSKIIDTIGDLKYEISPLSFFQVNPIQTKVLYDQVKALAQLTGKETVFDLYCGIGTISLYLSKEAKQIYGIEIVPEAIEDAKQNSQLNKINNVQFISGKSEEKMPRLIKQGIRADVVIVDPPRKGCEETLLKAMVEMNPEKIIYVSCNPSTLARDLKILNDNGYKIQAVQPVDMFPHTGHVETVVMMSRVAK